MEVRELSFEEIQELKEIAFDAVDTNWIQDGYDVQVDDEYKEYGEGKYDDKCVCTCNSGSAENELPPEVQKRNAKFIATFNPFMVQCLIKSYENMRDAFHREIYE